MSKAKRGSRTTSATTTLTTGSPTVLNQKTGQQTTRTVLTSAVDWWQLADQAGTIHGTLLPDIRRLRDLSDADFIQHTHNNLQRLLEREALTAKEVGQIGDIFETSASKIPEQIRKLHNAITSEPRDASLLAVVIANIAIVGVRGAEQPGFSWKSLLRDLGGAVTGGLGGVSLGPDWIVGGAVAGAVAASL